MNWVVKGLGSCVPIKKGSRHTGMALVRMDDTGKLLNVHYSQVVDTRGHDLRFEFYECTWLQPRKGR